MPLCTHISAPKLSNVPTRFVWNCTKLDSVDLPKVKELGSQSFNNTKITSVPNAEYLEIINDSAFAGCQDLEGEFVFQSLRVLGATVFQNCNKISLLDFGENQTANQYSVPIRNNVFEKCASLKTVILRSPNLLEMQNVSAFNNTPFAIGGTGGTVYVPQALITEYQNATNWSTLYAAGTCNFVAIEGSEYE